VADVTKILDAVARVADRLSKVADQVNLASTMSIHRKTGHVAYLRNESIMLAEHTAALRRGIACADAFRAGYLASREIHSGLHWVPSDIDAAYDKWVKEQKC